MTCLPSFSLESWFPEHPCCVCISWLLGSSCIKQLGFSLRWDLGAVRGVLSTVTALLVQQGKPVLGGTAAPHSSPAYLSKPWFHKPCLRLWAMLCTAYCGIVLKKNPKPTIKTPPNPRKPKPLFFNSLLYGINVIPGTFAQGKQAHVVSWGRGPAREGCTRGCVVPRLLQGHRARAAPEPCGPGQRRSAGIGTCSVGDGRFEVSSCSQEL